MRRVSAMLALAVLAAAAAVWLALREGQRRELGASVPGVPSGAPDVRPASGLAAPVSAQAITGAETPAARAVVEETLPLARPLVVEIQDARGAPVAGEPWAVFRGEEVLASGTTGADGIARVDRPQSGAQLAVAPHNHPVQVFHVEPGERLIVTLDAGLSVAGVVRIDGFEPAEPLELRLGGCCFSPGLNRPVWEALGDEAKERDDRGLATRTGAGGAFRFDGLPADSSWELSWSGQFLDARVPDHEVRQLTIEAPAEGLVLVLESTPVVVGRVVDATGAPVAQGYVQADGEGFADSMTVGADGRFRLLLERSHATRIAVYIAQENGSGARSYPLDLAPGRMIHDAGDLAVGPTRVVEFVVRDAGGAPLDARVTCVPLYPEAVRTDAQGRGAMRVDAEAQALRAMAAGFSPEEVALTASADPVAITLQACCRLSIQVTARIPGAGVSVRSAEPPFLQGNAPSWEPEPNPGARRSARGEESATFYFEDQTVHHLENVRPGLPLTVELVDSCGNTISAQAVPPLQAGEERVVILTGGAALRTLAGRLSTPEGQPVAGATILLGSRFGNAAGSFETDSRGCFRAEGLAADVVRLAVHQQGYAPLVREAQPVVEDPPVELVLDRGRTVRINVHGPSGEPVQEGAVVARHASWGWGQMRSFAAPGPSIRNAPFEALALEVQTGGRRFEARLEAGTGPAEVDVLVPRWQRCTLHLTAPRDLRSDEHLHVELTTPEGTKLHKQASGDEAWNEIHFPMVFPGRHELRVRVELLDEETLASEPRWIDILPDAPMRAAVELSPR